VQLDIAGLDIAVLDIAVLRTVSVALVIDLTAMRGANDRHNESLVFDVVENPVVANANAPGYVLPDKFLGSGRPRVAFEC
jgi:hypothetical protein